MTKAVEKESSVNDVKIIKDLPKKKKKIRKKKKKSIMVCLLRFNWVLTSFELELNTQKRNDYRKVNKFKGSFKLKS